MSHSVMLVEELNPLRVKDQNKILIVDDDRLILMALEQTIKREGHEILKASNGEEAVEILRHQRVAVIICDQMMPGISGIDVLKQAQEICPETIRILLTGNRDLAIAMEAINIGHVSQFIEKPWEDALLRQTVNASIEKYKLVKENQKLHDTILLQHKALAIAHENLRQELTLGARIHETLLVGKCPTNIPSFSIAAMSIPSKEIDGDFFEFYQPSHEIMDLVIGDVMGKGIPAALVGTAVKTQMIRFAIPYTHSQVFTKEGCWQDDLLMPHEILKRIEQEIAPQLIELEYFVTLLYGRFNSSKKTFTYVDCGSTKPIHYRAAEKKSYLIEGTNYPLGIMAEDYYQSMETTFAVDDLFVFYSDGVTEMRSEENELYGTQRIIDIVEKNPHLDANELLGLIKSSVLSFGKKDSFDDDCTIIVIKVKNSDFHKEVPKRTAKFSSDFSQLDAVRDFIKRLCLRAPGDTTRLSNLLQLAINEAFCNIVKHGYQEKKGGVVLLQGELRDDGFALEISDQGKVFNPAEIQEPSLAGDQENGFGWYIIRDIADQMSYIPKQSNGGWNHLRIFKHYYLKGDKMQFVHTTQDQILIITPEIDSLDAKDSPEFKTKVIDLITHNEFHQVIFDLHRLQFIDSTGLGTFLSVLRVLNTKGGELKLARMNKPIRTMFELVSMHKIFEIFNSTEEAIRSFQ